MQLKFKQALHLHDLLFLFTVSLLTFMKFQGKKIVIGT